MEKRLDALTQRFPAIAESLIILPKFATLLLALFRDTRVPRWLKVLTAGMVTYVALPFDFIPDFVPLIGKGDDIVVILLILVYYMKFCPQNVLAEHWLTVMGDSVDTEESLRKALVELEPIVGARYEYFRDNFEKLLVRIPRRASAETAATPIDSAQL